MSLELRNIRLVEGGEDSISGMTGGHRTRLDPQDRT